MKSKHITILASLLPRTQQCKSVSKGSYTAESASVWVQAANAEASIEKGHGRLYASTSARSSLLLLQLSQPGYRLPHPLWQPTVRDTKVNLPFCHSKGVTPHSTLPYLPPHYSAMMRGRKA